MVPSALTTWARRPNLRRRARLRPAIVPLTNPKRGPGRQPQGQRPSRCGGFSGASPRAPRGV